MRFCPLLRSSLSHQTNSPVACSIPKSHTSHRRRLDQQHRRFAFNMSPSKKLITIFGATGNQGGGVVQTFLDDPKLRSEWAVRGITRSVDSASAKKLSSRGVEMVAADVDDPASLHKALEGSYAAFAVTNYWATMDAPLEVRQGKAIADAAKAAGVQHYIWSTLMNANKLTNGKLRNIEHFDSKAEVADYITEIGIPATFFMPGAYMTNFDSSKHIELMPDESGTPTWTMAYPIAGDSRSQIPVFYPGDAGKFIKAIVLNREKLLGKNILAATSYMSPEEVVAVFRKVFPIDGKNARFLEVTEEQYVDAYKARGFPEKTAVELKENMQLFMIGGYYGGESLDFSHSFLEDKPTTLEEFFRSSKVWANLK